MAKLCQKFTANIQEVMRMTRDFDELEKVRSNILQLQSTKDNINDELSSVLSEYQEFFWPAEKFPRINLTIGGDTAEELQSKLDENYQNGQPKFYITSVAQELLESIYRTTEFRDYAKHPEEIELIFITVKDLGFNMSTNMDKIFSKAQEKGLAFCPFLVGPYLRLKYFFQKNAWFVAMEGVSLPAGKYGIFVLNYVGQEDRLTGLFFDSNRLIDRNSKIVFQLPKIRKIGKNNVRQAHD